MYVHLRRGMCAYRVSERLSLKSRHVTIQILCKPINSQARRITLAPPPLMVRSMITSTDASRSIPKHLRTFYVRLRYRASSLPVTNVSAAFPPSIHLSWHGLIRGSAAVCNMYRYTCVPAWDLSGESIRGTQRLFRGIIKSRGSRSVHPSTLSLLSLLSPGHFLRGNEPATFNERPSNDARIHRAYLQRICGPTDPGPGPAAKLANRVWTRAEIDGRRATATITPGL